MIYFGKSNLQAEWRELWESNRGELQRNSQVALKDLFSITNEYIE